MLVYVAISYCVFLFQGTVFVYRVVTVNRQDGEFGFSLSGNAPVFIRSVDGMSAADQAGVNQGDYIFEINGLDVR